MAYFRSNEPYPEDYQPQAESEENYYDGFDELTEAEETIPELSEEEFAEQKKNRVRLAYGAGNLFGIIIGTLLILILLTLLFSIVYFVINDMGRSFSLFQTNF